MDFIIPTLRLLPLWNIPYSGKMPDPGQFSGHRPPVCHRNGRDAQNPMGKEEDILRGDELIIKNVKTNKVFSTASTSGKFRSPSSFYFPVYVPSKRIVPEEASPTRNTNGWSA